MPNSRRRWFATLFVLAALIGCSRTEPSQNAAATVDAQQAELRTAAVAMPDRFGADVAEKVLGAGGNAVDAAIAAGLALAVTYPEAGNIGGGGFMLIHMNGDDSFLDYREKAPAAAGRDMYLDANGDIVENLSLVGHLAVGVPGTVAGFWKAHQRYGSMPWRDLVLPAVSLARDGFIVPQQLADLARSELERFDDNTNFSRYFGSVQAGDLLKQPELADTLRRIAETGVDDFYRGETARLVVAEMGRGQGLITMQDLANYAAVWREPVQTDWRNFRVISAPLPSSGGLGLIQLLKIHDHVGHYFEGVAHNSSQYVHLVAEIEKRVFADRARFLGDPDFVESRIDELLNDDYIRRRALQIDPASISMNVGAGTGLEEHDTTHYSIVDQWGNSVANTYTLNLDFGSGVVVTGAGFLLNDEMDDFSIKPGVPNAYGVVGDKANEIAPGKRMLSSMAPTILLRDGEVAMVLGTPGGSTIFTTVFQVILNIVDFGMSPLAAISAARFHHQLLPPDLILMQPGAPLADGTISLLNERGYETRDYYNYGDVQIIYSDGSSIQAASDPRNRGESRVIEAVKKASN